MLKRHVAFIYSAKNVVIMYIILLSHVLDAFA